MKMKEFIVQLHQKAALLVQPIGETPGVPSQKEKIAPKPSNYIA